MPAWLDWEFKDTPSSVSTFDELPLWSAPFGILLLKHVALTPNSTVLDIGSGAGFPLLELAQRLGPTCKCYGIDTWTNANDRARLKMVNYGVPNVEVLDGSAASLPFPDAAIALIVSNLGINNVSEPDKVFGECLRVLNPGGRLAITTNLNGHWKEFYGVFAETLSHLRPDLLDVLKRHEEHRGTVDTVSALFTDNGFTVSRHFEDQFEMRFLDGTAFLNHYFVKLGWMSSWKDMIPENIRESFFEQLEQNLNSYAARHQGLTLTVPMAFIEGLKS